MKPMRRNYYMDNKTIKKLVYRILKEEMKEYNVEVEVLALTPIENVINIILTGLNNHSKKLNEIIIVLEDIIDELHLNKINEAYYMTKINRLKILLKREPNISEKQYIWSLLINIYHEFKHAIIAKLIKKPYIETKEELYYALEDVISPLSNFFITYHDDFYEEIMANNYATKKAELFLKENKEYKKLYQELATTIGLEKLFHQIFYRNYNFRLMLNEITKNIKENIKEITLYPNDITLEIVRILYDENGNFKSLEELSKTDGWNILSKEAQYLVISSDAYLKDFDYKNATKEELYFILDALSYSLTLEYERPKYNHEFRMKLEKLSRNINISDNKESNLYLDTLNILNIKEETNKIEIEKLKNMINTIITLIKQKEINYQGRRLIQTKA